MKKINSEAAKRVAWLRGEINRHNKSYYQDNQPTISDFEFDLLLMELQTLEKKFPELYDSNSPTVRVGSDIKDIKGQNSFIQRRHKFPMLSLSNTYDKEELNTFNERIVKLHSAPFNYVCELKIDGSAISLTYRDGVLISAITRGDGEKGDDVTRNVKKIKSLPRNLKGKGYPDEFEIRGEIFMPWKSFDELNKLREENEEPLFANPRNAAAGSLKLLDSEEAEERNLDIILYHVVGEKLPFKTHSESLISASSWGLPVSEHTRKCENLNEVFDFLNYWDKNRKSLPYPTDGAVIKVDSLDLQKELGFTAKSPRWATAFKFKAESAVTRIVSVDFQVGRTGAITPVANLEPVLLSGTVVKRASLHNLDQMQILNLHINDFVCIEKGGEIIPKIVSVDESLRSIDSVIPQFPEKCPDCGTKLVREENEAKHFCPNNDGCPTQLKGKLLHFSSRKAMNILAGDATVEMLYNAALLNNVADFYKLKYEDLLKFEGWREKAAGRLITSIEESKKVPFTRVLYALGIRHIGESGAKSLALHFGDINKIAKASKDELLQVDDIGETVANSIMDFFSNENNIKIIEELRIAGVQTANTFSGKIKSEILNGKTIVVTGNFSVSRDEIKMIIEEHSGKNSSSVSAKTSILLCGSEPGPSKVEKAEKLGTEILNEEEFFKLIENN